MQLYSENNFYQLYQGNMLEVLDLFPCNFVSSIVTDPPYELNFMGKGWDNSGIAFQKETWEKCFKVLKPGGYMLVFGGSRTFHRIACAIEDAGFEIRDTIMWLYGSGFPHSTNVSKLLEKKGIEVDTHIGTCLKPAFEPVIIARKPCEGSCVNNVLKYGVGGINIDGCRIEHNEDVKTTNRKPKSGAVFNTNTSGYGNKNNHMASADPDGRFPSNVILTYGKSDYEEVCGDMPSKNHPNGSISRRYNMNNTVYGEYGQCNTFTAYQDSGSVNRYFYCAKATKKDREEGLETLPDGIFRRMRSDKSEENPTGLNKKGRFAPQIRKNTHPTVKPTELMQYLVRLVTPEGGIVLDPFNGSGSTGKAVMYENKERHKNYKYIGIELTEEYLPIAKGRIEYVLRSDPEKG